MKKIFLFLFLVSVSVNIFAQSVDGATYALPKTGVRLTILIERKSFTPGLLAVYARKYLRDANVGLESKISYSIAGSELSPYAMADTSKIHTAHVDPKHYIEKVKLSDCGTLLAINADAADINKTKHFVPAKKVNAPDYRKYLSQDILSVGSKMKMAELVAKEIYDIRESRSELTRGQADFMPKDGEQLKVMLRSLDEQELALRSMFEGTLVVDTTEAVINFMPLRADKTVLFRFSENWGLCDATDLSGAPYYINVEDLHSVPPMINELPEGKKAPKDETGVWVNRPGKIRATILKDEQEWKKIEFAAGQFGETENLGAPLFSKKVDTKLILNPYNGGIDKIESNPITK